MPEAYIVCAISDALDGRKHGEHIVTTEKDCKPYGIAGKSQSKLLSWREKLCTLGDSVFAFFR